MTVDGTALLAEFDQEMGKTRTMLERVPADRLDWRPHERSYSLLELAGHVSNLPSWTSMTMVTEELDLEGPFERTPPTTKDEVLDEFDRTVSGARAALQGASAEDLAVPWTLRSGDHTVFTIPRSAVHRSMVMNHLIHHRAQLGVYLRLLDVPVPGMYGPSADER